MVTPLLDEVRRLGSSETLGALTVVVEGPGTGARAVIEAGTGYVAGALPEDVADDVLVDAEALMRHEQSRTLVYGERRVFIDSIAPSPVLVIFGAGHIAQPLSLFARELGFRVVVSDARATWATPERFPDVDELIVAWPEGVLDHVELDSRTYVALLSHDPRFEEPVFPIVRRSPVRYVGAMGSRRTHRQRIERLKAAGWSDDEVARIHGPIGLDIGAETPAETAISILGEMIQVRYGSGSGLSLRGSEGRIHHQRGVEEATA